MVFVRRPQILAALGIATLCFGADRGTFEVHVPPAVHSADLAIRYFTTGAYGVHDGWIEQRPDVTTYVIGTEFQGLPAAEIKAVLYAPGCAVETFSRSLIDAQPREYDFGCRPLATVPLTGIVKPTIDGREFEIETIYVASWAHAFFGAGYGPIVTTFAVSRTSPDANGRFSIALPDFAEDPVAGAPGREGVFELWAKEKNTGDTLARLAPGDFKAEMGGLQVAPKYPRELGFTACGKPQVAGRDAFGFAKRSEVGDCE